MAREPGPPVDPNVVIPRAVREASERSSAAQRASIGMAEPPVIPPASDPKPGEPQPPAPTPPVVAQPAAEPPSPPRTDGSPQAPTNGDESWEAKYKTLHGRFEAERKRSREGIEQLTGRVHQLERQLTQTAQPHKPPDVKINLSPDEIADYGEDFVGMVKRIAEGVVDGKVAPLTSEVGRQKAAHQVVQNQSMHEQMNKLFPQWAELNAYEPFIEWVMLPDPYSGAIRQGLMQEAWDAGDARRVNAFFQGFLAEEAALNPAGGGAPPAPQAPAAPANGGAPVATPPLALASLAAPGGARSAPQTPAEKPVYTTEDITRFYTEVAAGKWRARDQERATIDADIMRAQHEGRIITKRAFAPPPPPQGFTR